MHKLIRLLKRPGGLDPTTFAAKWLADAQAHAQEIPGLVGYVQNHCLPGAYRKMEPIFDGYSEEYYATPEERDARGTPAGSPIAMECKARCVTLPVTVAVLQPGDVPEGAIKSIELIRRRPDVSQADFDLYWLERHGPLARAIPFLRYEQNHLTPAAAAAPAIPFHGAAITWFETTDDMRSAARIEAYRRTRADEINFLEGPSPLLLATSRVVLRSDHTPGF
ncbi:EthD domain-containing protein [Sphingomonas sp.]|uniref:EthD domain-containing protein n=1 Tax=Sphingomonas sp. TaxID=28214 RepID=UPI003D6D70DD